MEILAEWKPAIFDGRMTTINGVIAKRTAVKLEPQIGPSTEGGVLQVLGHSCGTKL
jgi:hypothetical protein